MSRRCTCTVTVVANEDYLYSSKTILSLAQSHASKQFTYAAVVAKISLLVAVVKQDMQSASKKVKAARRPSLTFMAVTK